MGSRLPPHARPVPQWKSTLVRMKENHTHVRMMCLRCGFWADVDIDLFIALLGWDGSLWDRRPPCENGDCNGLLSFHASPGPGTPFWPLSSGVPLERLPPQAWMGGWIGIGH